MGLLESADSAQCSSAAEGEHPREVARRAHRSPPAALSASAPKGSPSWASLGSEALVPPCNALPDSAALGVMPTVLESDEHGEVVKPQVIRSGGALQRVYARVAARAALPSPLVAGSSTST